MSSRSPRDLVLNTLKKAVKNVEAELAKMTAIDSKLKKDSGGIPSAPKAPKAPISKDEYCSAPPVEKATVGETKLTVTKLKSGDYEIGKGKQSETVRAGSKDSRVKELVGVGYKAPDVEKASVSEVNSELKGFKSLAPKLPGTSVSQVNSELKGFKSLASDPTSMPKLPGISKSEESHEKVKGSYITVPSDSKNPVSEILCEHHARRQLMTDKKSGKTTMLKLHPKHHADQTCDRCETATNKKVEE